MASSSASCPTCSPQQFRCAKEKVGNCLGRTLATLSTLNPLAFSLQAEEIRAALIAGTATAGGAILLGLLIWMLRGRRVSGNGFRGRPGSSFADQPSAQHTGHTGHHSIHASTVSLQSLHQQGLYSHRVPAPACTATAALIIGHPCAPPSATTASMQARTVVPAVGSLAHCRAAIATHTTRGCTPSGSA